MTSQNLTASQQLFDRALAVTPGGVNSPVRAFGAVGGTSWVTVVTGTMDELASDD